MPVRKHGKGFQARIRASGQPLSRTFAAKKDAQEWERLTRIRLNDHEVGRVSRYTLDEAIYRWLTNEAAALASHRSMVDKVRTIQKFTRGKLLTDVVSVSEAVKRAGLKDGSQPATINRKLACLRRVAKLAYKRWEPAWLDRDLGAKIHLLGGEQPRFVQATPTEVRALMLAAGPRIAAYIEFAALSGFRRGELFSLTPDHFKGGSIVFTKSTKGGKPRVVPLPAGLTAKRFPFGMTMSELRIGFEAAREKAKLPHLQFRDLRRTFGSWIVQRTKSLKAAQDLLGHTSSQITSRHYAHLLEGDLREAVATLPRLRANRGPRKIASKAANIS